MYSSLECIKVFILVTTLTSLSLCSITPLQYSGCYSGCGRFLRHFNSTTLENKDCADFCKEEDVVYAATRRQFCGCTNSLESLLPIFGEPGEAEANDQCDETCPGDKEDYYYKDNPCLGDTCCGGEDAYSVFIVDDEKIDEEGSCVVRILSSGLGYLLSPRKPAELNGLKRAGYTAFRNSTEVIWYMSKEGNGNEILFLDWKYDNYLWSSKGSYLAPLPKLHNIADVGWILKKNQGKEGLKMHNGKNKYLVMDKKDHNGALFPKMKALKEEIRGFNWRLEKQSGDCSMFRNYFD